MITTPRSILDVKTQVVTSPEFNVDNALQGDMYFNICDLWDGLGGLVQANLYEKVAPKFENCLFLIASNRLPKWC